MSDLKNDALLERYREASAREDASPSARVREAVLARAGASAVLAPKIRAANDSVWSWKIAASIAVIGFTAMIVQHTKEAPPQERAVEHAASKPDRKEKIEKARTESEAAAPIAPLIHSLATPSHSASVTFGAKETADVVARKTETDAAPPRRTAQVTVPQPSAQILESNAASARNQDVRTETSLVWQPEKSTGDALLDASPAPLAKIAAAPLPEFHATQAPYVAAAVPALVPAPTPPVPVGSSAQSAAASAAPSSVARGAKSPTSRARAIPNEPAIIVAIRNGDSEALRRELTSGAGSNTFARDGTPALTLAAQRARADDVIALLRAGANVNVRDVQGRTALGAALALGNAEIVALLRAAGAVE